MVEETIDPCCGCIKLRTGCIILGYFQLVLEVILSSFIVLTIVASWSQGVIGAFTYFWTFLGVVMLVFLAMSTIACILLLVGLHKNHHEYVVGYVKHARGCIFITFIFCARRLIWPTAAEDFTQFRVGFILLLWQCYFLLVLQCYCESVGEQPEPATTEAEPAPALALVPLKSPLQQC